MTDQTESLESEELERAQNVLEILDSSINDTKALINDLVDSVDEEVDSEIVNKLHQSLIAAQTNRDTLLSIMENLQATEGNSE